MPGIREVPMGAEVITRALGGKWYGRRGMAMCPVHDNRRTPALSLADGADGRLLVYCFAGCDGADILRELSHRGINQTPGVERLPLDFRKDKADRRAYALSLWGQTQPIVGTKAEEYLSNRGISRPYPKSLRFCPSLRHAPSRTQHPAIVALVTKGSPSCEVGIHRTFISSDATKANVRPAKMMLGDCSGGAVRLADDGHGPIVICEGIETGLSLRDALASEASDPRIWAALSTSGIVGIRLPETAGEIVIAPDGDVPGYIAAEKLARRAKGEGRRVRIMSAPPGKDWNDVAQETADGGA